LSRNSEIAIISYLPNQS